MRLSKLPPSRLMQNNFISFSYNWIGNSHILLTFFAFFFIYFPLLSHSIANKRFYYYHVHNCRDDGRTRCEPRITQHYRSTVSETLLMMQQCTQRSQRCNTSKTFFLNIHPRILYYAPPPNFYIFFSFSNLSRMSWQLHQISPTDPSYAPYIL